MLRDSSQKLSLRHAGQWEELLPLCTFQGDFSGLRDFVGSALVGTEAKMVGDLHWVLESRFARASAVGAITTAADWNVTMGGLLGVTGSSCWFKGSGSCWSGPQHMSQLRMQATKRKLSCWHPQEAQSAWQPASQAFLRKQLRPTAPDQSIDWMRNHWRSVRYAILMSSRF